MTKIIKYGWEEYSEDFVRYTLFKVAQGLFKMHQKNVCHRQVMTENVLSSSNGDIKLAALGGRMAPVYAPEVVVRGAVFSKSADVWAFGCLAYEMGTGVRPFAARPENQLLHAIVQEEPDPIPDRWTPCYHDFVNQCFIKDAHARPPMESLLQHEFLAELSDPARLSFCKSTWCNDYAKFLYYD